MALTTDELLKRIAAVLIDHASEISGVFMVAVKRDGSLPEIVADYDDQGWWDVEAAVRFSHLTKMEPRIDIRGLWDSREHMAMKYESEQLITELEHPHVCDQHPHRGYRYKTARGLAMHKRIRHKNGDRDAT